MFSVPSPIAVVDDPRVVKPYRLAYEMRPGYLYVHFRSDTTDYEIIRQYWNEIIVMATSTRCKRLLIEKDISVESSMVDAFRIASEIAVEFKSVKVAICDWKTPLQVVEFEELVATNRGLNTRTFRQFSAAEAWLMESA
ncbi:MAG: hypothetical protein ABJB40_12845 [Acidobacteriota bacterium]